MVLIPSQWPLTYRYYQYGSSGTTDIFEAKVLSALPQKYSHLLIDCFVEKVALRMYCTDTQAFV